MDKLFDLLGAPDYLELGLVAAADYEFAEKLAEQFVSAGEAPVEAAEPKTPAYLARIAEMREVILAVAC